MRTSKGDNMLHVNQSWNFTSGQSNCFMLPLRLGLIFVAWITCCIRVFSLHSKTVTCFRRVLFHNNADLFKSHTKALRTAKHIRGMGADNLLKFPNTHDEKGVTGWLKDVILYSNKKKKIHCFFHGCLAHLAQLMRHWLEA